MASSSQAQRDAQREAQQQAQSQAFALNLARKNIIIVKVGTKPTVFFVNKAPLCLLSSFFQEALNGRSKEAETREVVLEKEDPEVYGIFVSWMYTGFLYETKKNFTINAESEVINDRTTTVNMENHMLVKVWLFGEHHGAPKLQNAALDALHQRISETWTLDDTTVMLAFGNTIAGPPTKVRTYLALAYASVVPAQSIEKNELHHMDFFSELGRWYLAASRIAPTENARRRWAMRDLRPFYVDEKKDYKGNAIQKEPMPATQSMEE